MHNKLKILIVNFSDINGGAARAAYRLHESLINTNIDSNMLVNDKSSDDFRVISSSSGLKKVLLKAQSLINPLPLKFYPNTSGFSTSFSPSFGIADTINNLKPDIVHLHWINAGMIKVEDIAKIKAPIVWSLHDMWAFTGGCHYNQECEAYLSNCGNCPILTSAKENDLSRSIFNRKQKVFNQKKDITVVGLSTWLNDCSKSSTLFKDKKHINLPNPINTNIFKPSDKMVSRKLWNLPENKKLVLFGAMKATSDLRKGFIELTKALKNIKDEDIELVVFGSSKPKVAQNFGLEVHYLGNLSDDTSLVTLYSAVDVMIVPSLQENLSNAIMESLACGTPVVGFDIGGNSDMIDHKKNGYLATPYDTNDLAIGISWILNNEDYNNLYEYSRKKVLENFDSKIVANKYINLYKEIINDNK